MTRNNSTSSSPRATQTAKEKQPRQKNELPKVVRFDANESSATDIIPNSPAINQTDDHISAQNLVVLKETVNEKRQNVLIDGELGNLVGEYDIYMNHPEKRLMLLQYPNRDSGQPYSDKTGLKPLELRIKPRCGVVEVDVPMIVQSNFDKEKGIHYGQAMRKSRVLQEGGSYGLTGGLRGGNSVTRLRSSNADQNVMSEEPSGNVLSENFEDANNKGHVMNRLTLGGRIIPWEDGDPIYFLGVFKGRTISLSRLDAMVQLRPLFTHLDALTDLDKSTVNEKLRSGVGDPLPETEAKAVNMTAKSTEIDDPESFGDMGKTPKLLKAMREEPWQRLSWIDSEDEHSYRVFTDEMFVQDHASAPQLVSTMTNEQWLDALSCPRIDPIKQGKKVSMTLKSDNESTNTDSSDIDSGDEELSSAQQLRDAEESTQTKDSKPALSRSKRKNKV